MIFLCQWPKKNLNTDGLLNLQSKAYFNSEETVFTKHPGSLPLSPRLNYFLKQTVSNYIFILPYVPHHNFTCGQKLSLRKPVFLKFKIYCKSAESPKNLVQAN